APAWLSLDSANRLVGQPPPVPGGQTYSFTITARDGVGPDAVQNFVLTTAGQATPAFTSPDSAGFTQGVPGHFTVTAASFPSPHCTVVPAWRRAGLFFSDLGGGTGAIYGPPALGTSGKSPYSITVTATDNNVFTSLTQALTVVVAPPAPTVQLLAV